MTEMEDHSASEGQTDVEAEARCMPLKNYSEAELSILKSPTSVNNVDSNVASPAKCTNQQTNKETSSLGSSTLPSDQVAEAQLNSEAEPVQIKKEIEDDYYADDELTNEKAMWEDCPIDVKKESDSYSDESESDDEEFQWDNLVIPGTVPIAGNDGNNSNVSNGADETVPNNQGGDPSAGIEDISAANGGSPAVKSENGQDQNSSSLGSEARLVIPRKRKKAAAELPDVDTTPRQKRSAFKKCTEWFKQLTGEIEDRFCCPSCNETFASQRKLKDHLVTHKTGKPSKANEKVVELNEREIKVMAELLGGQNGVLRCEECLEVFSTRSGLSRHQRRHGEPRYSCDKCHNRFFSRKSLVAHLHIHSGKDDLFLGKVTTLTTAVSRIRKLKCSECDARFAQQWSLEQHVVVHSKPVQELECKECGDKLSDVSLLAKHQESHAGHRSKSYDCGECDQRFSHKSALFKHQLSHVERGKAECPECKDEFAERSELKAHRLAVHGTENLCVCTECNKSFSTQAALKRHLLTHNEDKRFKCSVCKEIFAQKSTLTRHALLHGGEQFYRFTCSVCDRKFSRRETLNDHMRTHTGERPFVCAVCHEGFTQKSAMRRHQILHFKERKGGSSLAEAEVDTGMTEDILLSLVYADS